MFISVSLNKYALTHGDALLNWGYIHNQHVFRVRVTIGHIIGKCRLSPSDVSLSKPPSITAATTITCKKVSKIFKVLRHIIERIVQVNLLGSQTTPKRQSNIMSVLYWTGFCAHKSAPVYQPCVHSNGRSVHKQHISVIIKVDKRNHIPALRTNPINDFMIIRILMLIFYTCKIPIAFVQFYVRKKSRIKFVWEIRTYATHHCYGSIITCVFYCYVVALQIRKYRRNATEGCPDWIYYNRQINIL